MKGDDSLFLTFGEPPLYNPTGDNSMEQNDVQLKILKYYGRHINITTIFNKR